MSALPWSAVDDATDSLLTLVAEDPHPSSEREWTFFVSALEVAAEPDGRIDPNYLRELVRYNVAPRRVGAFTNRALKSGLIAYTGEWVTSTDTEGRNAGRPVRVARLTNSDRFPLVGSRQSPHDSPSLPSRPSFGSAAGAPPGT